MSPATLLKGALLAVFLMVIGIAGTFLAHYWKADAACSFRVDAVAPSVFVETRASGEQIAHQMYQAHLTPFHGTTELCMTANAQSLFDQRLRSMADRDGKTQVWVTYYTDVRIVGDQKLMKTFRVIFVREGDRWRRLDGPETSTPHQIRA